MFASRKRVKAIEDLLNGTPGFYGKYEYIPSTKGALSRLTTLEAENQKLKAVVAELCDYVYANVSDKVEVIENKDDTVTIRMKGLPTYSEEIFKMPDPNSASGGTGDRTKKLPKKWIK